MKIKLIALDLDGTLLGKDHMTISDENRVAIQNAKKQGIKIVIATGRSRSIAKNVIEQLGVVDYIISANGASIVDLKDNKELYSDAMNKEEWSFVYHILKERNIVFDIYANGEGYVERMWEGQYSSSYNAPEFNQYMADTFHFVENIEEELKRANIDRVEKFNVFISSALDKKEIVEKICENPMFSIKDGHSNDIELTLQGSSKGDALHYLCDSLSITKEEVMAFGDSDNDVEMLAFAKYSIAMGNAIDKLKNNVYYVTDTNENSGVAKGIAKGIALGS